MKKDFFLSQREGLAMAMKQLQHYNVWAAIRLDEKFYEEEALLNYFEADFGDPLEAEMESVVAAAINQTVYGKDYIPLKMKKAVSKKCARQQIESLRAAKIVYHEEVKGMSRHEAQARLKGNKMASRIAFIDTTVKRDVRRAAKAGISYGIGAMVALLAPGIALPAWLIGFATYGIISILPDKVKQPIRKGAKEMVDQVVGVAKDTASRLAQKGVEVGKKVASSLEKIGHTVKQLWEDTKVAAKEAWEETKVAAKQNWEIIEGKVENVKEKIRKWFLGQ